MVFYIHAFPERLHHPKESGLLFVALRACGDEAGPLLDRLDAEHSRGEAAVMRLAMDLIEVEQLGPARLESFAEGVERYVDAYLRHMEVEEREVLPLAERVLGDADWRRIVAAAPAPVGLGPALRCAS
ncbi:MAG: hemerythrin domain-containing protein [Burkholderiales bacterium]|nr:hemerythrin domain-containing protein [Burkholderiales bacterium]